MARGIEEIKTEIKTEIRTHTELDNFLFPEDSGSAVSVFNLIIDAVAIAIATFEQVADALQAVIQGIADAAPSGNARWVRNQILNFQYTDTITLTDFVPSYAVEDDSKKIVTQCSVKDSAPGTIDIKVAKGSSAPFSPLITAEMDALKDYYFGTSTTEGIGFAGVYANFISLDPDRIRIEADIYFQGENVEATVKANVITAIDEFLASFSDEAFDGTLYVIRLVDAIQAVAGVERVVLQDLKVRDAATALGSASNLDVQGVYNTVAGHIISEDTASNELDDTLTMIRA